MRFWALLLCSSSCLLIRAQCCSGGVPLNGNIGLPISEKGTLLLNLNFDSNVLKNLKSGSEHLSDKSRTRLTQSYFVELGYSFTNKISLDVFLPFVIQKRIVKNDLGRALTITSGVGDIAIMPKYEILNNLVLGIGIKIPTGSSSQEVNGIVIVSDLQPGSGSFDHIIYTSYESQFKKNPNTTFFGTGSFTFKGKNETYFNDNSYKFGNEFNFSSGISSQFLIGSILVEPSFVIMFRTTQQDEFNNQIFPNSGGTFLFGSIGLSVPFDPTFSWFSNYSRPIYTNVQGTQLTPSHKFQTGVSFKL